MKRKDIEELYHNFGDKLIKVRSKITEDVVYIDPDSYVNGLGNSSTIWGQVSLTDETGWYFDIDDLEVTEE